MGSGSRENIGRRVKKRGEGKIGGCEKARK